MTVGWKHKYVGLPGLCLVYIRQLKICIADACSCYETGSARRLTPNFRFGCTSYMTPELTDEFCPGGKLFNLQTCSCESSENTTCACDRSNGKLISR